VDTRQRSFPHYRETSPGRWSALEFWTVALACSLVTMPVLGADPPTRAQAGAPAPANAGLSGAAILDRAWPGHPEWLAMLADIMIKGERLSGGDGWFRTGVAQRRFDWMSARKVLDTNHDDSISSAEFGGPEADFARIDRNRDNELTAADFDFVTPTSGPSPGALLFGRADRDGNGKIDREELFALFTATDTDGLGFLTLADLQQAFAQPAPALRGSPGAPDGPTRLTFLKSFVRGELGAFPAGPALETTAPDFTLKSVDGRNEITLSKVVGPKPVVLVFGNFTCRPFRAAAGDLEKLQHRYKDRATFLMIYVREAHPSDGWRMEVNDRLGVTVPQPRTYDERVVVAQTCKKSLGLSFPVLVDKINDPVNNRYSGIPSRLYLIDGLGKIAYKSGRGPFGFKPAELEHSLVMLLEHARAATTSDLNSDRSDEATQRRPRNGSR
jgi:thiol-disulfide isomerase/thioredoxin